MSAAKKLVLCVIVALLLFSGCKKNKYAYVFEEISLPDNERSAVESATEEVMTLLKQDKLEDAFAHLYSSPIQMKNKGYMQELIDRQDWKVRDMKKYKSNKIAVYMDVQLNDAPYDVSFWWFHSNDEWKILEIRMEPAVQNKADNEL